MTRTCRRRMLLAAAVAATALTWARPDGPANGVTRSRAGWEVGTTICPRASLPELVGAIGQVAAKIRQLSGL